ncbi:MAG: hypothetical protein AABO57_28220 [Acidobacteriota bacterium]
MQVIHEPELILTGVQLPDEEPHLLRGCQGLLLAIKLLVRLNALDLKAANLALAGLYSGSHC